MMKKRILKTKIPNCKLYLSLILLIGLILRLTFFIGLNWSDDVNYVYLANQILKGEYKPSYMSSLRLMMIFPLAFFFSIFGINNFSAVFYPLILSIGNIILIFHIGRLIFNEKVGLIAALLMAFYPLDVNYATWIMPDVPISFFTGLSAFLFLKAGKKKESYRKLLILSGIFAGLSYLLKLSGLVIFVFFMSYYLIKCMLKKRLEYNFLFIFLGFSLVFLAEGSYYYLTTSDFLLQFHSGFEYFTQKERLQYEFLTDFKYYPLLMFNLDNNFSFMWHNPYTYFGIFYYLVTFSIVFLLIKKIKQSFIIILWFLSIFLYMQFGTMSFKDYIPMHRLDRHLTLVSIPSILILSIFLGLSNKNKFKTLSSITLIILCISFLVYIKAISELQRDATKDMKLIFKEIEKLPTKPVYSDAGTIGHLMFYSKFEKNNFKSLDYRTCDELHDSYVIINATRGWIEFIPMFENYPSCVFKKPNNWILKKTIHSDANTYPYNIFDPQIFYVS